MEVDTADPAHPLVTIAPGTTIEEMNEALREHGLAFPTNVVPTEFHMIAVAATGSHGTGIHEPTVSDFVEAVELVDAHGRLRRFTSRDGEEVMNAVRLSLGTFGIIWRMTLRCVPAFNVREVDDLRVDMESAIPRFGEWVTSHDYTELVWWPLNRCMRVRHYDRVTDEVKTGFCRHCWLQFVQRVELVMRCGVYALMMLVPPLTPLLMRIMYRASGGSVDTVVPVEWAVHHQAGLEIVRATNAEVAFPVDRGFENVKHAWRVVVAKTREYQGRGSYPFNMALVARFVQGSPIPMSPAYGTGLFCLLEIASFADTADWVPYSTDVMTEWLKIPHARPHWAKESRQFSAARLREIYGHDLRRFLEIRQSLDVDPADMFVNDYLEQVFYGGDAWTG